MILLRLSKSIIVFLLIVVYVTVPVQTVVAAQLNAPIYSETAILMDADTGQILYEKDMHKVMRPASITKIMTALVALENADLGDTISVPRSALRGIAPDAAQIFLLTDEEVTLEQIMHAMAIESAADASNVIAEHVSGSVREFVKLMNTRARELGALNTNFVNTHGMPDNQHRSTAYDMALIAMAAVNTPGFNEVFSARRYVMPPNNRQRTSRVFRNQNQMLTGGEFAYRGFLSGKTGWTQISGHTLFSAARRDDRTLVCIVLKSTFQDVKYRDTTRLFNYGFNDFDKVSFSIEELEGYSIRGPDGKEIAKDLTVYREFSRLLPKPLTKDDVDVSYTTVRGDFEGELHVRFNFSLKDPDSWPGFSELGEVIATATLIEPVIERMPVPDTARPLPGASPSEASPVVEEPADDDSGFDSVASDGSAGSAGSVGSAETDLDAESGSESVSAAGSVEPAGSGESGASGDGLVNDRTYLDSHLLDASPIWARILKDMGIIIAPLVILLCYAIIRKRH